MRYSIEGEPLPIVICELDNGEMITCEGGAMAWMTPNMKMETKSGGVGKLLGRAFSGESLFLNHYMAEGGSGMITFTSNVPGTIRAFQISLQHSHYGSWTYMVAFNADASACQCIGSFFAVEELTFIS